MIFLLVCATGIMQENAQTIFTVLKLEPAFPKPNTKFFLGMIKPVQHFPNNQKWISLFTSLTAMVTW